MTGGGSGLGLTQGEALAQAGATVYALDVYGSPPEQFARTEARQPNMHYRTTDVRSPTMLAHTMRDIAQRHGRLDGLIAGAGVLAEHAALDHSRDDFTRILDVNVTGAFLSAQAAAREMVRCRSPGSIVLVASMSGLIANRVFSPPFLSLPVPPFFLIIQLFCCRGGSKGTERGDGKGVHMVAYNASKGAVHQMARSLAAEWGVAHGIRVNTLSPGYILTDMVRGMLARHPGRRDQWGSENMIGRISRPKEYRSVFLFSLFACAWWM